MKEVKARMQTVVKEKHLPHQFTLHTTLHTTLRTPNMYIILWLLWI